MKNLYGDLFQAPWRVPLIARAEEHQRLAERSGPGELGDWHIEQAQLALDLAAVMGDARPLVKP